MNLTYKTVEGFQEEVLEIDTTSSPTTVYLRKNIVSVPNLDEDGNETEGTHWRYEEAQLTIAEYQEYLTYKNNEDLTEMASKMNNLENLLETILGKISN